MWTPSPPSRSIRPCRTSTVARASESARWLGVVVELNTLASEDSLQLGASSRVITRRASLAVSSTSNFGHGRPCSRAKCWRKPDVERGVVRDEDAPGRELQERGQRRLDRRGVADHRVADAGQHGDERRDLRVRVDQRLELAEHLAAPDLHRADLGDHRPGRSGTARRLEVDHAEGQVTQRPPQLVEAALRLPAGRLPRRTVGGGAHVRRR